MVSSIGHTGGVVKLNADARGDVSCYEDASSTVHRSRQEKQTKSSGRVSDRHETVLVLTKSQYRKFEECMTNPKKPTAEMVTVAGEMLAFSKKFRS